MAKPSIYRFFEKITCRPLCRHGEGLLLETGRRTRPSTRGSQATEHAEENEEYKQRNLSLRDCKYKKNSSSALSLISKFNDSCIRWSILNTTVDRQVCSTPLTQPTGAKHE